MTTNRDEFRIETLFSFGASMGVCRELLQFNTNPLAEEIDSAVLTSSLPLPSESHVEAWSDYATEAETLGISEVLRKRFVQFAFPIREGISKTEAYKGATQSGTTVENGAFSGLALKSPEKLRLQLYPSLAGVVPTLVTSEQADFVSLVQGLTERNEPTRVPHSMGACFVSGYNNWDRVHTLRARWREDNPDASEKLWLAEFQFFIKPNTALYQDKFLILMEGPYSNVSAEALGLDKGEWLAQSFTIRLEHECTHYLMRRLLSGKGNALVDEIVADYWGIVRAIGRYSAEWALRFFGLENYPNYREGGRLQNYYGQPALSSESIELLHKLIKRACENLESFSEQYATILVSPEKHIQLLIILTCLTIEELASDNFGNIILRNFSEFKRTNQEARIG